MKPALHPQGSGSPIFRWRRSLSGPSAGPCRHLPGCPRAATGAHRTAQEGVKVAHSSRQAAADSGQPRRFRRERARRNPGWSLGRSERAQTPHQPWSGREWVGGGPARKPAFSRLPLSAKPIRLAVRQLVRLFCASQPRCEGFSLGKKAVVKCLPRSNAREAQGPGIPEGD